MTTVEVKGVFRPGQRSNEKPRTIRILQPTVLREAIDIYLVGSEENSEGSKKVEKLRVILKQARTDGFSIDQVKEDLERNLSETRRRFEGTKMGFEPTMLNYPRSEIINLAEDIWTEQS